MSAEARLMGVAFQPLALAAERTRATPPQALGEAMEVPFMSWRPCCVHCGTGAMAPPGADSVTPTCPSGAGPLLDHVYCWPCSHSSTDGDRRFGASLSKEVSVPKATELLLSCSSTGSKYQIR